MLHFTSHTRVSQAVLAGGSGVHVMTTLVTFPATDNGLCFLTLCVNLSNKTERSEASCETGYSAQTVTGWLQAGRLEPVASKWLINLCVGAMGRLLSVYTDGRGLIRAQFEQADSGWSPCSIDYFLNVRSVFLTVKLVTQRIWILFVSFLCKM